MGGSVTAEWIALKPAKIGSGLILLLQALTTQHRLDESVNVVILIQGNLTPSLQEKLQEKGLTVQGIVGSVVSGRIQASNIPAITAINEVVLIDLPELFRITPPPVEFGPAR
ncbi:MAG: hypothetical protein KGL31_13210 [candidate division NC10 bacterium]|nr:hypothetical protein [candidate division NC10 bacterium]